MGHDEHGPAYPEPSPNYIVSPPRYRCPICKGDENRFMECEYPMCPDGRDQMRFDRWRETYPTEDELREKSRVKCWPCLIGSMTLIVFIVAFMLGAFVSKAPAMDHGFNPNDNTVRWFERLQRPNQPGSCCGKGDAYPVSAYWDNHNGTWTAKIGDGSAKLYPDGTKRDPIETGTEVVLDAVLVNKLEDDLDNPTDTSWIFMTVNGGEVGTVYCLIRHPEGN